jgi:CHAT domain-containing protein
VVLSACNTGVGLMAAGEGVFSIARAFLLSGVKNVIFTQWSVADKSSAKLMHFFYRYLSEGYPTDISLQKAKIDFIRTTDPVKSHPYYWGGYIQMGNPMILKSSQLPRIVIGAVFLLALLLYFIVRERSRKH